jgi:hypothetical protein
MADSRAILIGAHGWLPHRVRSLGRQALRLTSRPHGHDVGLFANVHVITSPSTRGSTPTSLAIQTKRPTSRRERALGQLGRAERALLRRSAAARPGKTRGRDGAMRCPPLRKEREASSFAFLRYTPGRFNDRRQAQSSQARSDDSGPEEDPFFASGASPVEPGVGSSSSSSFAT